VSRIYRATIKATYGDNALAMPSFHYQTDVPPLGDEPDPQDVADALWSHWGSAALAALGDVHVASLLVTEEVLPPDIGVAGEHTVNLNGTMAAGTGTAAPDGLTVVLNRHTGTRSRSSRGWTLWPGPSNNSYLNHNVYTAGALAAYNALAALLDDSMDLGSITPTHLNPVVYSKTRRQREEEPWTFRVTSVTVNSVPHWLRSRMTVP
jgi:hypothetical protein